MSKTNIKNNTKDKIGFSFSFSSRCVIGFRSRVLLILVQFYECISVCWLQPFAVIKTESKNILIRNFYRRSDEKVCFLDYVHNAMLYLHSAKCVDFITQLSVVSYPLLLVISSWDQRELHRSFSTLIMEASSLGLQALLQSRLSTDLDFCKSGNSKNDVGFFSSNISYHIVYAVQRNPVCQSWAWSRSCLKWTYSFSFCRVVNIYIYMAITKDWWGGSEDA